MRSRTTADSRLALAVVLAPAGCQDAADTQVEVPAVDVPETISPGTLEGSEGGEGG
jgi:hypothetical protein